MTLLTTYAFAIQLSTSALALINNSSSCFTRIEEIKVYLKTEDNRRKTTTMSAIRTAGLQRLDEICNDLNSLIAIQRVDVCISHVCMRCNQAMQKGQAL
ncbi:hypothetical protein CPB85DRAFT_1321787 [Mucidula mucida]|nr:hypothetical protein CPB85DRAFT_1321787 [Mucidula mucida]